MHFSNYKRTSSLGNNVEARDIGLYLGASLGATFMFTEKFFANVEYEWAYLAGSYYRDDEVQSVMIGIGTRF